MTSKDQSFISKNWPQPEQFRRSIRLEFSLYVSALILALMAITGYIITDRYVDTVSRSVVQTLLAQARSYSAPAGKHILAANGPDALMLSNICRKLAEDNSDLYWCGITGPDSVFLAHTDIKQVVADKRLDAWMATDNVDDLRSGEKLSIDPDTIKLSLPIVEGDIRLGQLALAADTRSIRAAQRSSILTVASITALMILLGIPLTMILMHRKLKPVSVITNRLKNIDFEHPSLQIPVRTHNEFGYLAETLRVMGDKLGQAQREMIERERIARELEIARDIQASILPKSWPQSSAFEFAGAYSSAREVGGDYYDFIDFDEEHLAFLVADVSGKSLPGMLVMLMTRDIVREVTRRERRPDRVVCEVNRGLLPNIRKGMFVTMFYGLLDKRTGQFEFASAGHNKLIHMQRDGHTNLIKTKGYPLGMMPAKAFDSRLEPGTVTLSPDDWLIQYTDGINEAQNEQKQEYGMDRFVGALTDLRSASASVLTNELLKRHEEFVGDAPQYDDITLVALKWFAAARQSGNGEPVPRREADHVG